MWGELMEMLIASVSNPMMKTPTNKKFKRKSREEKGKVVVA